MSIEYGFSEIDKQFAGMKSGAFKRLIGKTQSDECDDWSFEPAEIVEFEEPEGTENE